MKELDRLQTWLPFRYQVLKGKANYVSVSAFAVLRANAADMSLEDRLGLSISSARCKRHTKAPLTSCVAGSHPLILPLPNSASRLS